MKTEEDLARARLQELEEELEAHFAVTEERVEKLLADIRAARAKLALTPPVR